MLQKAVADMPQEEASYHIKRCVDSGLWVPGGNDNATGGEKKGEGDVSDEDEIYEECNDETETNEQTDKPKQVSTDDVD